MPEKNIPFIECLKAILPYLYTCFLAAWGGVVHHIQKMQCKKKFCFNWKELFFDITVSSFAGLLTYFLCQAAEITGPKAAFLIAISGHMGTRAIATFQRFYEKVLTKESE